jgi:hypothetical protein
VPDVHEGCGRSFRPGYNTHLAAGWLPALDGVVAKLHRDAAVAHADCCGAHNLPIGAPWSTGAMGCMAAPNAGTARVLLTSVVTERDAEIVAWTF